MYLSSESLLAILLASQQDGWQAKLCKELASGL